MEVRAQDREDVDRRRDFRRRAGVAALVAVALAGAVGLLVYAAYAVTLIFAGLLVGVMLDALTRPLMRWTRLPHGWALTVVSVLLFGSLIVGVWLAAPRVVNEARQLARRLPELASSTAGRVFDGLAPQAQGDGQQGDGQQGDGQQGGEAGQPTGPPGLLDASVVKPVARTLGATVAVVANVVVIIFIGLYAAAQPSLYVDGLVRLLPRGWRDRGAEALAECGRQLRRWMLGTLIAMSSAGVLTGLGLWLLGVPYAVALALLAAVLEIVPNFGPIAAAVPAIGLAAVTGEVDWWKVAALYLVVQTVQSYLIQPLTQERMVAVPPVLLIAALVLAGWLLGTLGLLVAVPALVVVMVLVRLLYLRDTLGEQVTPQPAAG